MKNTSIYKDKTNMLIAALIVVAIVLGYLIYLQNSDVVADVLNFRGDKTDSNEQPQTNSTQNNQPQSSKPLPETLTDEEREVFEIVAQGVPQEKSNRFNELIDKLSIETNTLNLGNCGKPEPLVLRVTEGSEINVVNNNDVVHTFSVDEADTYEIQPGESKKVTADFYNGPSVYGYACDSPGRASGFISVISAN